MAVPASKISSDTELERARKNRDSRRQMLRIAEQNLSALQTGSRAEELQAAQAEVERLEAVVRHSDEPHGIVVDRVLEVISLPPEDMESTPGGIGSTRADFILGLGRHRGRLIIILDLATVLVERDFLQAKFRRERALQ